MIEKPVLHENEGSLSFPNKSVSCSSHPISKHQDGENQHTQLKTLRWNLTNQRRGHGGCFHQFYPVYGNNIKPHLWQASLHPLIRAVFPLPSQSSQFWQGLVKCSDVLASLLGYCPKWVYTHSHSVRDGFGWRLREGHLVWIVVCVDWVAQIAVPLVITTPANASLIGPPSAATLYVWHRRKFTGYVLWLSSFQKTSFVSTQTCQNDT